MIHQQYQLWRDDLLQKDSSRLTGTYTLRGLAGYLDTNTETQKLRELYGPQYPENIIHGAGHFPVSL